MFRMFTVVCGAGAVAAIVCGPWFIVAAEDAAGKEESAGRNQLATKPVEGELREFMGHFFKPSFQRLRQSIATKPTSDAQWKNIASEALVLAEGGNLLLMRAPDEQGKPWISNATGLRTFGTFVYRAAREKDYSTAVFDYRHMVEQCNDCHREFADEQPRLEP